MYYVDNNQIAVESERIRNINLSSALSQSKDDEENQL